MMTKPQEEAIKDLKASGWAWKATLDTTGGLVYAFFLVPSGKVMVAIHLNGERRFLFGNLPTLDELICWP